MVHDWQLWPIIIVVVKLCLYDCDRIFFIDNRVSLEREKKIGIINIISIIIILL